MSLRLSVCHTRESRLNGSRYRNMICTVSYDQLSYRRETALHCGLLMAESGRLELGDNIYGQYTSTVNHCDIIGQQSNKIR